MYNVSIDGKTAPPRVEVRAAMDANAAAALPESAAGDYDAYDYDGEVDEFPSDGEYSLSDDDEGAQRYGDSADDSEDAGRRSRDGSEEASHMQGEYATAFGFQDDEMPRAGAAARQARDSNATPKHPRKPRHRNSRPDDAAPPSKEPHSRGKPRRDTATTRGPQAPRSEQPQRERPWHGDQRDANASDQRRGPRRPMQGMHRSRPAPHPGRVARGRRRPPPNLAVPVLPGARAAAGRGDFGGVWEDSDSDVGPAPSGGWRPRTHA